MKNLELKDLYEGFRNPEVIKGYAKLIEQEAKLLKKPINIIFPKRLIDQKKGNC